MGRTSVTRWRKKKLNRDQVEKKFQSALETLFDKQKRETLEALGDPPRYDNLTKAYWDKYQAQLRGTLQPIIEKIALDSAADMLRSLPEKKASPTVGEIDWTLVNEDAVTWAKDYTYDLVGGLTDTTREELQTKVAAWYEQAQTVGELAEALTATFGPVRAELIASTETTRSSVWGAKAVVDRLNESGTKMLPYFSTSADELVCPECGPLDKKQVTTWPPVHPRCRCDVLYRFEGDDQSAAEPEPEAAPAPEPRANGSPVSNAFSELPGGKVGTDVKHAIDVIDGVHDDGNLPQIPIKQNSTRNSLGMYRSLRDGRAYDIEISRYGEHRALTTAHEVGHFIDHHGIGLAGQFSSESDALFAEWRAAVKSSKAVDMLIEAERTGKIYSLAADRAHVEYLLSTRELWARSYAQYIATKSGDENMLRELRESMKSAYPYQWREADFVPIMNAIDKIFKTVGWLP